MKPAPHKRMKTPPPECDVPCFAPWQTSDGPCHRCKHRWSVVNRSENFPMDPASWKTLMNKMYVNWIWGDSRCVAEENYVHIPTSLAQSLCSANIIGADEMNKVDTLIRTKLFLPFLKNHDKPLFVYFGGGKDKWVVVGCIRSQRATTIWYKDDNARTDFLYYFPDPAKK